MRRLLHTVILFALAAAGAYARADEAADQLARARASCSPSAPALKPHPQLSEAARRLSQGAGLREAGRWR